MIIKISKDLKKEEIWAQGVELASIMGKDRVKGKRVITFPEKDKMFVTSIKNPVLITDNYKIAQLNPTLRDTLFSLFSSKHRIFEYDGVITISDASHVNVWSPSIDTVLFAKGLANIFQTKKNFKTAVEIGTGSGFLGKYTLAKCGSLEEMLVIDINPYAIKSAMDNIKDPRAVFFTGDGIKKIKNQKFDLIICNPPYVPRPKSIDDNPYEGVGVLNYLIHDGTKNLNKGGVFLTNISSLCWGLVMRTKPNLPYKIIAKMRVPLKVNNILNNESWLNYLVRERGLKRKFERGYEYWQEIFIVAFYN
ncbi:MAG: methyltransferase [Candidatus Parcubacteria bacterium]|nr:methyltransferase [Candidatus Parcubacteria bacterium]